MRKILILMCGVPASGKSTVANNLAQHFEEQKAVVISMDAIREKWFGTRKCQDRGDEVYAQSVDDILSAFESCDVVIYDATNRTRKARRKLVETIYKYYDCAVYCVFMDTPLEVALDRNANRDESIQVPPAVIHRMFDTLETPREENEEYFDRVFKITPKTLDTYGDMWYNILTKQMAIIPPKRYNYV